MRLRTISAAGIGAAALVFATVASGATASASHSHQALRASHFVSSHKVGATKSTVPARLQRAGKCGTAFGTEMDTPDGLIAWNDGTGTGFDTAGGADFKCTDRTRLHGVKAYGYFGTPTETFHVTIYKNSGTDGSDEPNDNAVKCDYPSLTGTAGGQYPTHQLTSLTFTSTCKLRKGHYWISIQNVDATGPWYWEMQNEVGGTVIADWVDRNDSFGSGCTTFDNDRYLVDCLGYPYNDFMFKLT